MKYKLSILITAILGGIKGGGSSWRDQLNKIIIILYHYNTTYWYNQFFVIIGSIISLISYTTSLSPFIKYIY